MHKHHLVALCVYSQVHRPFVSPTLAILERTFLRRENLAS